MRIFGLTILVSLAITVVVGAQGFQQPRPQENLDTVLGGWEKAMTDLQSFVAVVERTTLDKALGARDQHKGYAMFLKALGKQDGTRARLEMAKVTNPKIFEKYLCTGTYLYEYAHGTKTVRVHTLPPNKQGGVQRESFLSFLFGMTSVQAKQRYDMTHIMPKTPDKYYHYILVRPKLEQDKSDFQEARLCLYRSNNLPAQVWYLQANKNEITWNFTKLQINVNIPTKYFDPDLPGKDWRVERVQPKPILQGRKVIRN
ncbi:MAG: TIGR03009 domain-containing protein [Planctomycetes bacterium]|nr:TIGR03009 domain-containing protein [Planctomycetota bacterium]